jgi:hypothetical protein
VQDGDCETGNICYCGEPVGRCVPANCTTDADCEAGFNCAGYDSDPGCFSVTFACQMTSDSCAATADCAGLTTNPTFCYLENGHRACTTYQCTTP